MKFIQLSALVIGLSSCLKINSEFPCGFKYTKENMIDEMDAFSRGLNKARYQNAYDIAQKLNLKLPRVNTTAYFIQGFNTSRANSTNITDDPDHVDAPSDTAITSLVSKFKYSLASSKNVSLAAETEYVKD